MKLKKAAPKPPVGGAGENKPGGAAIADRFRLDADPRDAKKKESGEGVSAKGAMWALLACLAGIGLVGVITWLMYQDWEYVQNL